MTPLERFQDTFLNPVVLEKYWPLILDGMQVTLMLAVAVVVTGILAGLLLACLRSLQITAVNFILVCFTDIFRALPPLVIILLVYFGFPNVGITLSGPMVVYLVLSLVLTAFSEEIFWAGITSVEKGQWEAARSTGLGFGQTLANVVLPQAVRLALPPLTNRAIAITKMTALGTVIGVPEILYQATSAQSFSGNASPLTLGALAYLALFLPFVILARWLESRFAWRKA